MSEQVIVMQRPADPDPKPDAGRIETTKIPQGPDYVAITAIVPRSCSDRFFTEVKKLANNFYQIELDL